MFATLHKWVVGLSIGGMMAVVGSTTANAAPPYRQQAAAGQAKPREAPPPESSPANGNDEQTTSLPNVRLIQERYPDGKIRKTRYVAQDSEKTYVNHGPFVQYSQSGRKIAAGEFNMGRYQGTWYRWYEPNEGALFDTPTHKLFQQPFMSEVQLQDDNLHSTWTVYDASKRKVSVWTFENGKRNGKSTWFYPDGRRAREVDYRDGLMDGKALAWSNSGQITEDVTYIKGRRLVDTTFWHRKGVKGAEGKTLFAMEQIETTYDCWNAIITYSDPPDSSVNEKTGAWTWWHANGQKSCEGEFAANLAEGHWVFWHKNGQKKTEGDYHDGKRIGLWATWAEDGRFVGEKAPDESPTVFDGDTIPATDSADNRPAGHRRW